VNGKPVNVRFDIWIAGSIGSGWTYIAYVLQPPIRKGEIVLNLSDFIVDSMKRLNLSEHEYTLYSIELGYEIFYSKQVGVEAYISKYWLVIGDYTTSQLVDLSIYSKKLVAWITPWGEKTKPESFNKNFTPGIVLAYDVECGLCSTTLKNWLNTSIELIEKFRETHGVLYINLFPEKYHPSWTWRGNLDQIILHEEIIESLRRAIGRGENTFLGFSELTKCTMNNQCIENLVELYMKLKQEFPLARFYYYGTSSEEPETLLKLKRIAGLELIGIDIWVYEYKNNRLLIPEYIVNKLRVFTTSIPCEELFIGEIGLRLNDREAYIEPWNPQRQIVFDEKIDEKYYGQILEQLFTLNCKSLHLGIWAWNDGPYAIMKDQGVQEIIEYYILGSKLSQTTSIRGEKIDWYFYIALATILISVITLFLLLYRKRLFYRTINFSPLCIIAVITV